MAAISTTTTRTIKTTAPPASPIKLPIIAATARTTAAVSLRPSSAAPFAVRAACWARRRWADCRAAWAGFWNAWTNRRAGFSAPRTLGPRGALPPGKGAARPFVPGAPVLGVAPPMTGRRTSSPGLQTPGPDRRPSLGRASPRYAADLGPRAGSRPAFAEGASVGKASGRACPWRALPRPRSFAAIRGRSRMGTACCPPGLRSLGTVPCRWGL